MNKPRNDAADMRSSRQDKSDAAAYIWKKMGMFGFVTGAQVFRPKQFKNMV